MGETCCLRVGKRPLITSSIQEREERSAHSHQSPQEEGKAPAQPSSASCFALSATGQNNSPRKGESSFTSGGFPYGPLVRTQSFHYCGLGFNPWSGNEDPTSYMARPEKKVPPLNKGNSKEFVDTLKPPQLLSLQSDEMFLRNHRFERV